MRYTRCKILFGSDFEKIQKAKILLLGVGGVGSFCLDAMYRTGITDITIVDYDRFDITNQNRQIGSENVGELKVEVHAKMYPSVTPIVQKIDPKWVEEFDFEPYDLVIDAIDDVDAKVAIMKKTYKKLISSMGSAKKTDPTKIEISDIWKTHGDKFARKIKDRLKKERFNKKIKVVFSTEHAKCIEKGSFCGVTGAFGLTLCSLAIDILTKEKSEAV
ncbi:MAG: tRNA threonylcarbamoyladenosine dehydratase [Campylobacterota bacterium]|nr:tRNA threonylcarbamoyladenosine dehydratase [Campylobacterota bacterium]